MGGHSRHRSGGQGTVYVAKDTEKSGGTERRLEEIKNSIISLASSQTHETHQKMGQLLSEYEVKSALDF